MNDHTLRIIRRMIRLIDQYKEGSINLRTLVDGLEGSINALEEKLSEEFYAQWHKYWFELYMIYDLSVAYHKPKLSSKDLALIIKDIEALRELLSSFQSEQE
jgi:hypothetical protein